MRSTKGVQRSISITILGLSLVFWIILMINPAHHSMQHNHHLSHIMPDSYLDLSGLWPLMLSWILMIYAMMLPKLIVPIQHVYERSLKRRRIRSIALFAFGYGLVWSIVGIFASLVLLQIQNGALNGFIPLFVLGVAAVIWQLTPIKQRFLNRGHLHHSLSAFGWAADRDAAWFGLTHGAWCVGSGWALMLFPMFLGNGHLAGMLIVTLIMISEHMDGPKRPRWAFVPRIMLFRVIVAQIKIKAELLKLRTQER